MSQARTPAPAEMSLRAVLFGLFLALVFGAANAYLGMKAGSTVSATIPAAVLAIAFFRLPGMKGGILEQNISRTAASTGEALVAGAVFTIPGFLLAGVWKDLRSHYWDAALILLAGGLLGVFFIILLRRPLCVDAGLPWPESVASVQITKAGEGGRGSRALFGAMALGAVVQLLKADRGIQIFREYAEGFLAFPASIIRHLNFARQPIASVTHGGGIAWTTPSLSPALLGIGYIIGPELAAINFAGGLIAWWMLIPLLLFFDPDLARRLGSPAGAGWDVAAYTVSLNIVRPVAVGTMLVSAAATLFKMRGSLMRSLAGAWSASAAASASSGVSDPSERDIPMRWLAAGTALLSLLAVFVYQRFTGSLGSAIAAAAVMSVTGFLLSAVGGYLVGLVGGSNQPISGLTLSALLISALVMLGLGVQGSAGVGAVLGVAAVVCCACSTSGSLIQDLKAGQLLGGTPWKMQVVEIVAVIVLSLFLMLPVVLLHEANLATGGIGGRALPAPQAGLMAQLAQGIVGGQMAWGLIGMGVAFGLALLAAGARAPMLLAVGMYLPFETVSSIFLGGVMAWLGMAWAKPRDSESRLRIEETGALVASGLIAGEALMGILLAATFLVNVSSLTHLFSGADSLPFYARWGGWLSLTGFAVLAWTLVVIPARGASGITKTER